jgi:23S rRNA (adenine2503-C2)-methyltransferase
MWDNIKEIVSTEETVSKFVFTKMDAVAESVLYKYPTYEDRTVICCSTQSGCPVGCRFCGAGDSFVRTLTGDEIVSQPVHLLESKNIDASRVDRLQIMFMSMGEPMLAWKSLKPALYDLYERYPKAALLISTSGPDVPSNYDDLEKVSRDIPTIGLQFSVHESTDEARNNLIPFKAKMPLAGIAERGLSWYLATKRQPFFNYCVHENNNKSEDVDRLLSLFAPYVWQATISVICERDETIAAANDRQRELASDFMEKMLAAGYSTRMFDPAGQDDVGGGCGQLWYVQDWMQRNSSLARPSIGRGLPVLHTPGGPQCQK